VAPLSVVVPVIDPARLVTPLPVKVTGPVKDIVLKVWVAVEVLVTVPDAIFNACPLNV